MQNHSPPKETVVGVVVIAQEIIVKFMRIFPLFVINATREVCMNVTMVEI